MMWLGKAIRYFVRTESGATAVYFALLAPVLIGFSALGGEVGLWLLTERRLQHITDMAAISAATRAHSTSTIAEIRASATARAVSSDHHTARHRPERGQKLFRRSHGATVGSALSDGIVQPLRDTGCYQRTLGCRTGQRRRACLHDGPVTNRQPRLFSRRRGHHQRDRMRFLDELLGEQQL
jgi:hypothetical protein